MAKSPCRCPESPAKHLIVQRYKRCYKMMAEHEYKAKLLNFAELELKDPLQGLEWKQLLEWEHRHLKYTKGELPKPRAELPIDIVRQAQGRCGEFALLYNGLLLTNGYQTRMVVDCSTLKDKSKKVAGDHVWVEILINNVWLHVDPTEKRINSPLMYVREWKKNVNHVYALTDKTVIDVTKAYS